MSGAHRLTEPATSGKVYGWTCPECGTAVETFVRLADPPGAAEMARWMDAWGREQPVRAAIITRVHTRYEDVTDEMDDLRAKYAVLKEAARAARADLGGWHRLATAYGWGRPEWHRETERVMEAVRLALDEGEAAPPTPNGSARNFSGP